MARFIGIIEKFTISTKVNYKITISRYTDDNDGKTYDVESDVSRFIDLMKDKAKLDVSKIKLINAEVLILPQKHITDNQLDKMVGKNVLFEIDVNSGITTSASGKMFRIVDEYPGGDLTDYGIYPIVDVPDTLEDAIDEYKDFLIKCKDELEKEIDKKKKALSPKDFLAELKKIVTDYSAGKNGYINGVKTTYGDKNNIMFYLLKYGYAYPYLYYSIYREILFSMNMNENLNILSIGCGSKMDLVGLKLAMTKLGHDNDISYYGVDPGDWKSNDLCVYTKDGSVYDETDIVQYLDNNDSISSNVIILPYSLSELTDDKYKNPAGKTPWELICDKLPGKLKNNRIVIATPLRSGNTTMAKDSDDFSAIIKAMDKEDFSLVGDKRVVNCLNNNDRQITDELSLKSELGYDKGAIKDLMFDKIDKVDTSLKAKPIYRQYIINYQIYVFKRNIETVSDDNTDIGETE